MAVIDTSMDIPSECLDCDYVRKIDSTTYKCEKLDKYFMVKTNNDFKLMDCPLKSTDEMIAEIEETYINNCDFNYQIAIDIIHKYCDKGEII